MLQSCRNIPTNVPNSPQASFLISDKIMKHVYITIWFNTSENVTHTVQDQNSMKSPRCVGVHVLVREVMRSWDTGRVDRKKSTLWLTCFKNMWGSQVTGYSYSWYRIFFWIEPLSQSEFHNFGRLSYVLQRIRPTMFKLVCMVAPIWQANTMICFLINLLNHILSPSSKGLWWWVFFLFCFCFEFFFLD